MRLTLPVREVLPVTARARIVRLDLQDHLFPYRAGQALLVSSHGADQRKPYSIAGSPEDTVREGYLELLMGVHAEHEPGSHLRLAAGGLVDVEGPVGRFIFPDAPAEQRFLFVAGGTGIAPLRAMFRHSLARGHANVSVLYSARTPDEFAYEAELRQMAADGRIDLRLTVTRDADGAWSGTRGRIRTDLLATLVRDAATLCFICGPRALVDDMPKLLGELGIARHRILMEEW